MNNTRVCKTCGQEKPLTLEYWPAGGQRNGKQRLKIKTCKVCAMKWKAPEGMRICRSCHQVFPETPEYFAQYEGGLRVRCLTCKREQGRLLGAHWRQTPKGQASRKAYAARPEVRERIRQQEHENRAVNRDHVLEVKRAWRARNPERTKLYRETERAKDPECYRLYARIWAQRRRALKRQTPKQLRYTPEDVSAQLKRQEGRCWWCADVLTDGFEIDHHIALSLGGDDTPRNIVCACVPCNRRKFKRLPWEFSNRLL